MERVDVEVVVVGGGLAGLTAAAILARAGRSVELIERAAELGGRARTEERSGFFFNQGAHALYAAGAAREVFRELDVPVLGGPPPLSGGFALRAGKLHTLPTGPVSLLSTGLLPLREKAQAARFLALLPRLDPSRWDGIPLSAFLDAQRLSGCARQLTEALFRLTTYANAPDVADAGASLRQLQKGQASSVLYLDGGWTSLVAALTDRARQRGASLSVGCGASAVERAGAGWTVALADGGHRRCHAVVLALGPRAACSLLPEGAAPRLRAFASEAVPIAAACLDLALRRLPRPTGLFALGVDAPLYLSVHSSSARLAPAGAALLHAMKYLPPGALPGEGDAREMEALVDRVQPGWREHAIERRFLPRMTVAHALVRADRGGLRGRPVAADGLERIFLAGDWVGPVEMLADASCASARAAARGCLGALGTREAAA